MTWQLASPWFLLGWLLVPLYVALRRRHARREAVPLAPMQYQPQAASWLARGALVAEVLVLVTAILALAGPYRERQLDLVEDEGIDVQLVLDVSLSMLAEDFPPTRLEALRRIARDFIGRSGGHRLGVVIFAKDAYVQTPLTTDHRVVRELLDSVTVYTIDQGRSGGTAIGDALASAGERLASARVEGRDQALVLITDGESNEGMEPTLAARYLRHLGIRLYAIGVGGEEPVEVSFEGNRVGGDAPYLAVLDDAELRAVAEAADGRFFRATDVGALEEIFAELSRLASAPLEVRQVAVRRSVTPAVAALCLILLVAQLTLRDVFLRRPLR